MRKRLAIALAVALLVVAAVDRSSPEASAAPTAQRNSAAPTSLRPAIATPRVRVLFSPGGGCTEAIVEALGKAKASVDVQAYSFTSAPIAEAVAKAFARGVKVRVVLDKSQRSERYTSATYLVNHNVPTWIDTKHAIAHNKIILVDGKTIFTGSFNFTKSAEQSNAENLLIIEGDAKLYAEYLANFEEHLGHSERYEGAAAASDSGEVTDGKPAKRPPAANKPASKRTRKAA